MWLAGPWVAVECKWKLAHACKRSALTLSCSYVSIYKLKKLYHTSISSCRAKDYSLLCLPWRAWHCTVDESYTPALLNLLCQCRSNKAAKLETKPQATEETKLAASAAKDTRQGSVSASSGQLPLTPVMLLRIHLGYQHCDFHHVSLCLAELCGQVLKFLQEN